jgi:2-keto-4-pentenoate hydratase
MDAQTIQQASSFLLTHQSAGTRGAEIPQAYRPTSKDSAYAIQALVEKESASSLFGWKIAATSAAGQKHIGVSGPLAGRYVAERVVKSGGQIPFGTNHMKVAEVEFAFRVGLTLSPRNHPYTEEDVRAAVASLHPAIEIPDSRYERFEIVGESQLIADNACANWLAVGAAFPETWRTLDLAALEPIGRVQDRNETRGKGSNVLGSPWIALTWIANELSSLGVPLKAGQTVTTGTCIVPMTIAAGDVVEGDFGSLGKISVRLGA